MTVARLVPALAVVGGLFGAALFGAVRTSLQPGLPGLAGGGQGGFTLDAWRSVVGDPVFADALAFSAWVTLLATALSAVVAVAVASLVRRRSAALRGLFALPVPVPHLIVAVTAALWLADGGLAERLLGTLPVSLVRDSAGLGVVLVYVFKEAPFLALLVVASWGPDVADRGEAAAVLGAGRWQRLRWVVWPAIRPAMAIGCLIVAAFAFGSFEVPLVVGPTYPPTVATFALDATRTVELSGRAEAAASLLVAAGVSVAFALVAARAARRVEG
jgi:putative spermidine/putrescine transport system permease protein